MPANRADMGMGCQISNTEVSSSALLLSLISLLPHKQTQELSARLIRCSHLPQLLLLHDKKIGHEFIKLQLLLISQPRRYAPNFS